MRIISMEYHNFRNIEQAKLGFDSRMNLICGINGQGKTNALEAICYLSTGRSYRSGVKEKDFLMIGKEEGSIAAIFEGKKKAKDESRSSLFQKSATGNLSQRFASGKSI